MNIDLDASVCPCPCLSISPRAPVVALAGDDETADFTAEVKIDTNDFGASAVVAGVSFNPDMSWKYPFSPATVACVVYLAGMTVPAGNTHTDADPPGVVRNIDCVMYSAAGLTVGALSIRPCEEKGSNRYQ